jgi:hypothetical protein
MIAQYNTANRLRFKEMGTVLLEAEIASELALVRSTIDL